MAWRTVLERARPAALCLTRQNLPVLDRSASNGQGLESAEEVARGGYVLASGSDVILIGTGSEVSIALQAREQLAAEGISARVVSMPCVEWFNDQDESYRREVLPPTIRARVSVEAGITAPWRLFVGDAGASIGVDHFGASAALPEALPGVWHHRGAGSRCRTRQSGPGHGLNARPSAPREGKATVSVDALGQLSGSRSVGMAG